MISCTLGIVPQLLATVLRLAAVMHTSALAFLDVLERLFQLEPTIRQEGITNLFTGEQARRVDEMFKIWSRLRNSEGTGELDVALAAKDGVRVPRILASFLPANQDFLETAADRFSEMVAETHETAPTKPALTV